jgi:hypothetical protein
MEAARLSDAVVIECSISTRAALAARAIVGPFAVDLPLRFPAGALRDLPDAAAAAATAIAALFDELPFSLDGSQYPWADGFAFSYLDRPDDLRVSWGKSVGRTVLHASPLWSALKLSAYRQGQSLELKLRRDPERYPAHVAEAILPRMRHCVLDWGAR